MMGRVAYFSLCLFDILLFSTFPEAEASICARNWLQNQRNCSAYFDTKMTWHQAEIECQSYGRGAHLASILSEAEANLLAHHISSHQQIPNNVWIGLHDPRGNRRWRWSDESVYNFQAWNQSQPNISRRSKYCVELLLSTGFKKWKNALCRKPNTYICKYQL
ncbi:C-type lectin [Anolis carolinensis]|uniref:C-type lectin domain-containing protein n=1 Tax=Anolis carolinensis TaxID=28377 RepID=R4GD37_ANOCA|nr:PREDICTED: C-type lectin [Anolis carolinensis]|eukprot:XP_008113586.1 PREDICTED: C-type lectin [Anolis carolinensis]